MSSCFMLKVFTTLFCRMTYILMWMLILILVMIQFSQTIKKLVWQWIQVMKQYRTVHQISYIYKLDKSLITKMWIHNHHTQHINDWINIIVIHNELKLHYLIAFYYCLCFLLDIIFLKNTLLCIYGMLFISIFRQKHFPGLIY